MASTLGRLIMSQPLRWVVEMVIWTTLEGTMAALAKMVWRMIMGGEPEDFERWTAAIRHLEVQQRDAQDISRMQDAINAMQNGSIKAQNEVLKRQDGVMKDMHDKIDAMSKLLSRQNDEIAVLKAEQRGAPTTQMSVNPSSSTGTVEPSAESKILKSKRLQPDERVLARKYASKRKTYQTRETGHVLKKSPVSHACHSCSLKFPSAYKKHQHDRVEHAGAQDGFRESGGRPAYSPRREFEADSSEVSRLLVTSAATDCQQSTSGSEELSSQPHAQAPKRKLSQTSAQGDEPARKRGRLSPEDDPK